MAKESMKAREVKRAKLVARYAEKRAALKKVIATTEDPAEAYEAARKLQAIPKNANPIRLHNRCKITGRPKGYIRQFGLSRIQFREMASANDRSNSRLSDEVEKRNHGSSPCCRSTSFKHEEGNHQDPLREGLHPELQVHRGWSSGHYQGGSEV